MWNEPSMDLLKKKLQIPKIYETDFIRSEDKYIYLHFFIGTGCDWYVAEFDYEDTFFGYANLNDDLNAEWGYILFSELKSIKLKNGFEIEYDLNWEVKRAKEIEKIKFR